MAEISEMFSVYGSGIAYGAVIGLFVYGIKYVLFLFRNIIK